MYFLNAKSPDPFTSKPDQFISSLLESRSVDPQDLFVLCLFLLSPRLAVRAAAPGPGEPRRGCLVFEFLLGFPRLEVIGSPSFTLTPPRASGSAPLVHYLYHRFPASGDFTTQGTLGNVGRHLWSSRQAEVATAI